MPLRTITGFAAILCWAMPLSAETPKTLLLIGQGPDGHPPRTHEYIVGLKVLRKCLEPVGSLNISNVRADEPWTDGPGLIAKADGVVLFLSEGAKWAQADPARSEALNRLVKRGGGVVGLHWGLGTKDAANIAGFLKLAGGCHGGPDRKFGDVEVEIKPNAKHEIAAGVGPFKIRDEFYYRLKFAKMGKLEPVMRIEIDGHEETIAWAWERPDGGRSFGFTGLHYHENWRREEYRRLVAQGVVWTLKKPIPKDGLKVAVTDDDLKPN